MRGYRHSYAVESCRGAYVWLVVRECRETLARGKRRLGHFATREEALAARHAAPYASAAEAWAVADRRARAHRAITPAADGPVREFTPADASPRRAAFDSLPWDEDEDVRAFVAAHPDGATLEEVGEYLGVTRERVRQMEGAALARLAGRLRDAGVTEASQSEIVRWSDGGGWWE